MHLLVLFSPVLAHVYRNGRLSNSSNFSHSIRRYLFVQCSVVDASDKTISEIIVELGTKITLDRLSLQLKYIAADGL